MIFRWKNGVNMILVLLAGMVMGLSGCACPEKKPGPISTDRPGAGTSPYVVPPCYPQIELGWTHTENSGDGEKQKSDVAPDVLVRLGLIPDLELRLGYAGYAWEQASGHDWTGSSNARGGGDANIGFKFSFLKGTDWLPESAFVGQLSLPVGSEGYSSERADPSFLFAFSNSLTDFLSLDYSLGPAWNTEEDDFSNRHTLSVFQWAVSLGIGITEKLSGFVEFYGDAALSDSKTPANAFDTGLTYLLLDNFQLDVSGGVGLSDAADDWYVASGFSYRFPN